MSRVLKERAHRAHLPAPRAEEPGAAPPTAVAPGLAVPAPVAAPAEHANPRHGVLVAAAAAVLAATAVVWGASSLADGTAEPTAPAADVEFQWRPLTGGVPVGP